MSYLVESFLKEGNSFVPLNQCNSKVQDVDYIEGAIVLEIYGKKILTLHHWDLVDQLWSYLLEGAKNLKKGENFETYFPDQPLMFKMIRKGDKLVEVIVGDTANIVVTKDLLEALRDGANDFYENMIRIVPSLTKTWECSMEDAKLLTLDF